MTEPARTILYLDDEAACLEVFRQTFGREYDIRTAANAREARAALAERAADIVIADQTMPGGTGAEFLRETAQRYPASCRTLLTGSVGVGDMLGEISGGLIDLFIAKPWDALSMSQALGRAALVCERRRSGSA